MTWVHHVDGGWRHRPWWKVAANRLLRFVQPRGPGYKVVIATLCEGGDDSDPTNPPRARGYVLRRVMHLAVVAVVIAGCGGRARAPDPCTRLGGKLSRHCEQQPQMIVNGDGSTTMYTVEDCTDMCTLPLEALRRALPELPPADAGTE